MRALVIAVLCLLVQTVRAAPIVIVETRDAPALPTLAQQVRLHAHEPVEIERADADPLTFAAQASALVGSGCATLVVWFAPVDGGYLVFVAGERTGRAITELVRIDARIGTAEIERTIALKIAGLLDEVVVVQAPLPVVLAAPVAVRAREAWRIEIGGALAYESHERALDGRVGVALGRTWTRPPWQLVPAIGGYWQPGSTIERGAGRVAIVEAGGIAMLEATRRLGAIDAFVRPRFAAAAIAARGTSRDGRRGRATVFAPSAGLEVGGWYAIANVRFGLVGGCDLALIRRELAIDDETVVDLGAVRLHVGLAMAVSL